MWEGLCERPGSRPLNPPPHHNKKMAGGPAAAATALELYDPAWAPPAAGQQNVTGVLCHFSALLQALASCTSLARAVAGHREYLARTATGRAFYDYFWEAAPSGGRHAGAFAPGKEPGRRSAALLRALVADLRARRPAHRYGPAQESATEGLVLLLEMLEPPGPAPPQGHPITRLFMHRYEAQTICTRCRAAATPPLRDVAVQFNLFHHDAAHPTTPAEFGELLREQVSPLSGYECARCGPGGGARLHRLRMVPEVLVCVFNAYGARRARYFPPRFPLPGTEGALWYRWVAQVEHHGGLGGGHYQATALRKGGGVYRFSDEHWAPARGGPAPSVYAVFYHADGPGGRTGPAAA